MAKPRRRPVSPTAAIITTPSATAAIVPPAPAAADPAPIVADAPVDAAQTPEPAPSAVIVTDAPANGTETSTAPAPEAVSVPPAPIAADPAPQPDAAAPADPATDAGGDQPDEGANDAEQLVEARVLVAYADLEVNDIVTGTADAIEQLRDAGRVDPHADAVAAARELRA